MIPHHYFRTVPRHIPSELSWLFDGRSRASDDDNTPYQSMNTATFTPAIELIDEGHFYTVEMELPGVKKADIDIRVGELGRKLIVEGKVAPQTEHQKICTQHEQGQESGTHLQKTTEESKKAEVQAKDQSARTVILSERTLAPGAIFRRVIKFPRPVDADKVRATLEDGVLIACVPKVEDRHSVSVSIQ